MNLTDYTSYDEIRAALGVSTDELEDTTLVLPLYVNALTLDLEDIDLTLPTTYSAILASLATVPPTTLSDVQQRFYTTAKLFATYSVAKQLTTSLPLFGPKDIGDGRATVSRFADSPYRDVTKQILAEYERYKTRLASAFAALSSATKSITVHTFLSVANGATDPVTNA